MLLHYKKNSYNLPIKSFYFSSKTSKYYILTSIGIKVIQLPISYFFKNIDKTSLSIIGISKTMNSFFNVFSNFLVDFYFIRLRIRGLGYRWRTISENFHYMFFNYTNYIYFFNPYNIIVKIYKKRMILVSYFWHNLRLVMSHILLLQKIGPYTLHGIRWAKQIIFLKKSGKKI
jgi:hypothetical protein